MGRLSTSLSFRQSQSLAITPQLLQAIKLLQLSQLEITQFVDNELEQNPLLERADQFTDEVLETDTALPDSTVAQDTPALLGTLADASHDASQQDYSQQNYDDFDQNAAPDTASQDSGLTLSNSQDWEGDCAVWDNVSRGAAHFDEAERPELADSESVSLYQHMMRQIGLMLAPGKERLIAEHVLGALDEAGYLELDVALASQQLGVGENEILAVISLLQRCEPVGVCARSLSECLSLQLQAKNRLDPAMVIMLEHLPLVAERDVAKLSRLCGLPRSDIVDMIAELRKLEPKPGRHFGATPKIAVVPDVVLRRAPNNGWRVELVADSQPRVMVNRAYASHVRNKSLSQQDRGFLQKNMQNAQWLLKSLEQRAQTILKVTREIVRHQQGFFEEGLGQFRPLTLRQVAEAVGLHESTISRVTTHKYLSTPRGTFELKFFFSGALSDSNGEDAHAAEVVKHKIRQMIASEDGKHSLSDDVIAQNLQRENIVIARRTVAKYREMMAIPTSAQRRRRVRQGA